MPLCQKEREEWETFFRKSGEGKGVLDWQRVLSSSMWDHAALLHALTVAAHMCCCWTELQRMPAKAMPVTTQPAMAEPEAVQHIKMSELLNSDPVTMLYDAALLLMQDRTAPQQQPNEACNCSLGKEELPERPSLQLSAVSQSLYIGFPHVACLLGICAAISAMGWLSSSSLSGRRGKLIWMGLAKPMLGRCIGCFLLSWCACSMLHMQGLFQLALCTCMHMCCSLLGSLTAMAYTCPVAFSGNSGLLLLSGMLLGTSFFLQGIPFTAEEFYTNHLWAVLIVCPAVKVLMGMVMVSSGTGMIIKGD
jgi:hypothetical protein